MKGVIFQYDGHVVCFPQGERRNLCAKVVTPFIQYSNIPSFQLWAKRTKFVYIGRVKHAYCLFPLAYFGDEFKTFRALIWLINQVKIMSDYLCSAIFCRK
jgi:hypothetical protein